MTDLLLPPDIIPNDIQWGIADGTGVGASPTVLVSRTATSYGNRLLTCQMTFRDVNDRTRAILMSMIQRGKADRYWLTDITTPLAGSMSAPELVTNGTFANGTTGYSTSSATLTVADNVARARATTGGVATGVYPTSAIAVTQYAPYVARVVTYSGRNSSIAPTTGVAVGTTAFASDITSSYMAGYGMRAAAFVPSVTSVFVAASDQSANMIAGDYLRIPFLSLAPGALVDNGPSLLQQSDVLGNAYWTATRASITSNGGGAPDGTTTADFIVEDSSNNTHLLSLTAALTISSSVLDYSFAGAFKQNGRSWGELVIKEQTGNTVLSAYFNLATGAKGTVTNGANWSNGRSFIVDIGNGWYYCCVVGRKTNAATQLDFQVRLASADVTDSYTGNGSNNIAAWRLTAAQSSVPTHLVQTTSAATTGTAQQGSAINLKGLAASTSGLLKLNDLVEINGELKRMTASLDSDAAGLGYLQFEPQIRTPTVDNAPVIFQRPMGKFMLVGDRFDWPSRPGAQRKARSDFALEFIEAPAA